MTTPHTKTKYLIQRLRRHATALRGKIEPPTPEFLRSVSITMDEAADRLAGGESKCICWPDEDWHLPRNPDCTAHGDAPV
jgi:hypothetical protein